VIYILVVLLPIIPNAKNKFTVLSFPRRRESKINAEKNWIPASAGMTRNHEA